MEQESLWILIARKLTGEVSDVELWILHQELRKNSEISYLVEMLTDFWNDDKMRSLKTDLAEVEKVWEKIKWRQRLR